MPKVLEQFATAERIKQSRWRLDDIVETFGMDVSRHRDDFQGDLFKGGAAPGIYQSTASGTAAAAAVTTGANGCILLDAGSDSEGYSDLSLGLYYTGSRYAWCWWYAKISAITTAKFELGLTDVVSGTDAGAVNSKSGNTWTADDAVVLCRDTADDTNLTLMGVKGTTAATAIDFSTTIAADTFYYFGIELRGTFARGWLLNEAGKHIEHTAWMTDAVTAATLLTPWAFMQNRAGSQRTMTIDLLDVYQRRSTS